MPSKEKAEPTQANVARNTGTIRNAENSEKNSEKRPHWDELAKNKNLTFSAEEAVELGFVQEIAEFTPSTGSGLLSLDVIAFPDQVFSLDAFLSSAYPPGRPRPCHWPAALAGFLPRLGH